MKTVRRVAGIGLCAVLVLSVVPRDGFGRSVRKEIASNSAAVTAELSALNLTDMPNEMAAELRGEGFLDILKLVWSRSVAIRALWSSYQSYSLAGWEIARLMAINEGLPDPGPKPNVTLLQRTIYWLGNRIGAYAYPY